jgi:signal transduction histidine kinase
MKTRSLTGRLIAAVLLAELLCAVCFSIVATMYEMHGRRHAFDIMLRGRADSLLGAVQDADDADANVTVDRNELILPAEDVYVVLSPAGKLLGKSSNADANHVEALASLHSESYFDITLNDIAYRVFSTEGVRVIDRLENGGTRRPVRLIYAAPTTHLRHEVVEAVRFYVLASALLMAATGILLAWLLRRWLSPLRELAQSAALVSVSSWEFAPSENALRTRELRPIVSSIRQLLSGLRESFERQQRFTGDAAHELKTSLALLKSSLQLMTLGPRSTEQYEEGLRELAVDVDRMEDLTERMLALARIEGEPPKPVENVDLADVVNSLLERLRSTAMTRELILKVSGERNYLVNMHPTDAEILVSNLLMNAVQHSPSKSEITISLAALDEVNEMRVIDHGEGIPKIARPHIFERFYRADESRSRSSGGTGLGLALCKAIVDRSRGAIEVRSVAGQGTEIIVTLPRVRDNNSNSGLIDSAPLDSGSVRSASFKV